MDSLGVILKASTSSTVEETDVQLFFDNNGHLEFGLNEPSSELSIFACLLLFVGPPLTLPIALGSYVTFLFSVSSELSCVPMCKVEPAFMSLEACEYPGGRKPLCWVCLLRSFSRRILWKSNENSPSIMILLFEQGRENVPVNQVSVGNRG